MHVSGFLSSVYPVSFVGADTLTVSNKTSPHQILEEGVSVCPKEGLDEAKLTETVIF